MSRVSQARLGQADPHTLQGLPEVLSEDNEPAEGGSGL